MADTVQRIYQLIIDAGGAKQGADAFVQAMGGIDGAGQQVTRTLAQLQRAGEAQDRRIDQSATNARKMSNELQLLAQRVDAGNVSLDAAAQKVEQIAVKYDAAARAAASFSRAFEAGNAAAIQSLGATNIGEAADQYAAQYQARLNSIIGSAGSTKNLSQVANPGEAAFGAVPTQGNTALAALQAQQERLEAFTARYEPLTAATLRYADAVAKVNAMAEAGDISTERRDNALKIEQELLDQVTAAQKRAAGGTFGGGARSIGGMELQASAINFVQGIAGGISPLRMLEAESTQVLGAFAQDAKGATAALTGMWNTLVKFAPIAGILGGVATVAGTLATAFFKGRAEAEAFEKAIVISGNAAGVTRGSFESLVTSIEGASNLGPATIRSIATEMVSTGKIATPVIQQLTALTDNYAKATGQDTEKAGSALAKLFSDPKSAMQQLDDQYNLLDEAQKRHIQDLILQGDRTQAQLALTDALNQRLQGLSNEGLGWLQRAWRGVEGAANDAWDAMKGIGRGQTLEEQLTAAQGALTRASNPYGGRFQGPLGAKSTAQTDVTRLQTAISGQNDLAALDEQAAKLREGSKAAGDLADQYGGVQKQSRDLNDQLVGMQSHLADVNAEISRMSQSDSAGSHGVIARLGEDAKNTATAIGGLQNQLHILARTPVMEAQDRLKIDQQVNAAPPTQRAALRARLTAQYNAGYSSDQSVANNPAAIKALGDAAATQALSAETTAVRDQNTQLDLNAKLTLATGEAWMKSSTEGAIAAAHQQAAIEALTQPINVNSRTAQILTQQINESVTAGAQQVRSLDDQVTAQLRLAEAAKGGPLSEHQAEVTNQIAAATKDLNDKLQLAFATKNVKAAADLQAQIKGVGDRIHEADDNAVKAQRSLQMFSGLEDQGYQIQTLQKQLELVGANNNERTHSLAILQATIEMEKEHQDLNSQEAQDYIKNAGLIADYNQQLERQTAIVTELPNAFDQAFDRIGEAVTQFAVQGGDAFKSLENIGNAVFSELTQEGLKLALINPVKNWFNGDNQLPTMNSVFDHYTASNSTAGSSAAGGGFFSSIGSWLGSLFADGGVMTSKGRLPLRTYSDGGITSTPQLAMFGEGSTPEAYVPVPSGKIPVEIKNFMPGPAANSNSWGAPNIYINLNSKEAVDTFRRSSGQIMAAASRGLQTAAARN